MRKILTACAGASLVLAGCASNGASLQLATASTVGHNLSPDSVVVSNVQRGMTTVKWDAATPAGQFACSADDMVRRPYCVKK